MTSDHYVPPAQWYAQMPAVHISASVLFTDPADRVLLVKPNYRPYWAFPGGIAEDGEPPHLCAAREAAEETGLRITLHTLLVVDWAPPAGDRNRPMMNFLFDGGTITDPSQITLQYDELDEYAFLTWDTATARFPDHTARRIPAARQARLDHHTLYLPAT
ncbi:NUDIX domain-containing protein [Actinomadura hibisca]|uniref:NUDIX domain-containing protein n=1 Tax=Actinomadura hibisca TaxID=68565 RepID=UPI000B2C8F36|nr:NUDIX hydrolase [Actinomadura hibisca]